MVEFKYELDIRRYYSISVRRLECGNDLEVCRKMSLFLKEIYAEVFRTKMSWWLQLFSNDSEKQKTRNRKQMWQNVNDWWLGKGSMSIQCTILSTYM